MLFAAGGHLGQVGNGQHLVFPAEASQGAAHRFGHAAAGAGAELAVLPEYFCLMSGNDRDKLGIMEPDAGEWPMQAEAGVPRHKTIN